MLKQKLTQPASLLRYPNFHPTKPLCIATLVVLANTTHIQGASAVTPKLNPVITQAINVANTPVMPPEELGSGDEDLNQPDTSYANNTTYGTTTTDDGGEVDIAEGTIPLPADAPIADSSITSQETLSKDTFSNEYSFNKPVLPSNPMDSGITQVPLGAISPNTIAKFVKMIDIIRQEYVKPVDDERLFNNAMAGTLAGLDPYSEYLDREAYNNLKLFTDGDMGSIGVKVSYHADKKSWVFDEVIPNSPAAKLGIQQGNFLHQINDNKLNDEQTQMDIDQLLSGIAGTQVKLVISDSGRRKHSTTVQRSLLQQQAIQAKVIQDVAVIQIPVFQNNTQQQVLSALTELKEPFTAILLDIRNNPGGVLTSASEVASLFMPNKTVVQVRNRQGLQEVIKTQPQSQFEKIPLAVLQNRYSASAAEVLASSLQENGRAKIYGETSYGKGSIQSIIPINDNEAVKLTVAHYYSANGKKIDGIGVKPDTNLVDGELNWQDEVVKALLLLPRPTRYQLQPGNTIQAF